MGYFISQKERTFSLSHLDRSATVAKDKANKKKKNQAKVFMIIILSPNLRAIAPKDLKKRHHIKSEVLLSISSETVPGNFLIVRK